MRKSWVWGLLSLLGLSILFSSSEVKKAFSIPASTTKYIWQESFSLTTATTDTLLPVQYERITVFSDTTAFFIRASSIQDTSSLSSKAFVPISAGSSITYEEGTKVIRVQIKTQTALTGTAYFVGHKKGVKQ